MKSTSNDSGPLLLGAIAGDIIGAPYEHNPIKRTDFPLFGPGSRFTDDTVLTVAVADALLNRQDYGLVLRQYARRYPYAGYGGSFVAWARASGAGPYNSWGNGSAMRVSPVAYVFQSLEEVLAQAQRSAEVTHNHPEGIKGAQATAATVFLSRQGSSKKEIKRFIEKAFNYAIPKSLVGLRRRYSFDLSCQGTVPAALLAFLESVDYEDAVRKAVSLGGDSDTLACITGAIAQAFYKSIPTPIQEQALSFLDDHLKTVVERFTRKFLKP